MMNALPDDIDKSELQIPWDYTRPAALEKAEYVQFELNETIKLIFPHWAYDEWLDLHAGLEGITRRPANKAIGSLLVTGKAGTVVPEGFQFATPANLTESIVFVATEEVTLDGTPDSKGQVTAEVPAEAAEGGVIGNVPPDTIILMVKPESGITVVTNPEAMTGGVPEESDDDLRERILDSIRRGMSYTGCDADYVRWAKEVPAVGHVVVEPEWAGAGTVRLFIVDANGAPANEQIIKAVYNHIVSPDDRMERLAPIGATVTVAPPVPVTIDVSATVTLDEGENLETVRERFKESIDRYWITAATERSVKYVFVGAALADTPGIDNYAHATLTVNGGAADISIALGEFPVTGEVTLRD
jgi:uncharacterized phage protein gp47/JayE